RARRTTLLRAYSAAERHRFAEVDASCGRLLDMTPVPADSATSIARALRAYAQVQLGRGARDPFGGAEAPDPDVPYELRYWSGIALLARGAADGASVQADALLEVVQKIPSAELEWRAAALGAAAARVRRDGARADEYARRAS